MLFSHSWPRTLLILGSLSLFSLPALAETNYATPQPPDTVVYGKGKRGGDPPRPKPEPGPREGGDDD